MKKWNGRKYSHRGKGFRTPFCGRCGAMLKVFHGKFRCIISGKGGQNIIKHGLNYHREDEPKEVVV